MAELNPFMEPTVTVAEPLPPCVNMTFGVDVSEKSGKVDVELRAACCCLVGYRKGRRDKIVTGTTDRGDGVGTCRNVRHNERTSNVPLND